VTLLNTILSDHFYYDQVQRLAGDHGLPISRRKDELVDELVAAGELEPDEVVSYLRVDSLRMICEDLGLPSGATRDVLAERVADALRSEMEPPKRRRKSAKPAEPEFATPLQPAPSQLAAEAPPREIKPALVLWPMPALRSDGPPGEAIPPTVVHVHHLQPSSVAWTFATILVGIMFGGALAVTEGALGLDKGALVAVVGAVVVAFGLLFTARRWVPWVDRLSDRRPPQLGNGSPGNGPHAPGR
jgi:hypothetical protein